VNITLDPYMCVCVYVCVYVCVCVCVRESEYEAGTHNDAHISHTCVWWHSDDHVLDQSVSY